MKRMLINASQSEELRVAMVENELYDLIVERPGFEQKTGNIYKGTITSVEPSLDAVFVNYGAERHGFLPFKEISPDNYQKSYDPEKDRRKPDLRELLKVGQEVVVRLEKEERSTKGAALTTYISLPGSFLVLMPNNPRAGGVTRQIEGEERDELRDLLKNLNVPEDMGLIIRTAGVGRSLEDLKWELDTLMSLWTAIKTASDNQKAPFLIHQEGSVVIRSIRDYLRADIGEVIVDSQPHFDEIKAYLETVRPDFIDKLKLYKGTASLFSRYEIEHTIETAYKRTVRLPSGGTIDIDFTEALVAIDINSGRATKGSDIEETAFNTNLEAAREIARQLRMRDIGGLIVIDFIDMSPVRHQREVENTLLNALKVDRARVQIQKISRFGLLEMSRQRLRPSLREAMQKVCPSCSGHGSVRSVESIAVSLFRLIQEEASKPNTSGVIVQASGDTSTFILNEKRNRLTEVERDCGVTITIIPNPNLQPEDYQIKRLRQTVNEGSAGAASYEMTEKPSEAMPYSKSDVQPRAAIPAVKQMVHSRGSRSSASATGTTGGLIKRLWSSMFGGEEEETQTPTSSKTQQRTRRPRNNDNRQTTRKAPAERRHTKPTSSTTANARAAEAKRTATKSRSSADSDDRPVRHESTSANADRQAKKTNERRTRQPRAKPQESSSVRAVSKSPTVTKDTTATRPPIKPVATDDNSAPVVIRASADREASKPNASTESKISPATKSPGSSQTAATKLSQSTAASSEEKTGVTKVQIGQSAATAKSAKPEQKAFRVKATMDPVETTLEPKTNHKVEAEAPKAPVTRPRKPAPAKAATSSEAAKPSADKEATSSSLPVKTAAAKPATKAAIKAADKPAVAPKPVASSDKESAKENTNEVAPPVAVKAPPKRMEPIKHPNQVETKKVLTSDKPAAEKDKAD